MTPDRTITIAGAVYFIRFGQNALYLLEQRLLEIEEQSRVRTGRCPRMLPILDKDQKVIGERPAEGLELLQFLPDTTGLHLLFWAGAECGRMKHRPSQAPISFEASGDLIDEAGGIGAIMVPTMQAFNDAFPNRLPKDILDRLKPKEETGEKNELEERRTGTPRSSKRSKSASPSTSSGV